MILYVSHPKTVDYKDELYAPLRQSRLDNIYDIILPNEFSAADYNIRELFEARQVTAILAEVSEPSTMQGVELGWASLYNIPIILLHKNTVEIPESLAAISSSVIAYEYLDDVIDDIYQFIQEADLSAELE